MGTIANKHQLADALHSVAELEHALCCCYLYAAFSLKRGPDEGGMDWPQAKEVRNWAVQLLIVARQEMEHLALVCNLLMAIGEKPRFGHNRFPYRTQWPSGLPELTLAPFSVDTISRFVEFERPDFDQLRRLILSGMESRDLVEGLGHAAQTICAQTGWEFGQAWLLDDLSGSAHPASVPSLSPEIAPARSEFDALVRANLASGLSGRADVRFWQGALSSPVKQHHHGNAEFVGRAFALGRTVPGKPAAVLVFFYCSHCQAVDDFTAETLVKDALELCSRADAVSPDAVETTLAEIGTRLAEFEGASRQPGQPETIGAAYREILKAFEKLDDGTLFAGANTGQMNDEDLTLTFPEWFNMEVRTVCDLNGAKAVIKQIVEEGEGTPSCDATALDPNATVDLAGSASHFARFTAIKRQFAAMRAPSFIPARDLACNPKASQATAANSSQLMAIFNDSYALMLDMLLRFFDRAYGEPQAGDDTHRVLPRIFLPMMSMVMRTLGETLTLCPMREADRSPRAGPGFELDTANRAQFVGREGWRAFRDRLVDLSRRCRALSTTETSWGDVDELALVRERLSTAADNLQRMAFNLETGMSAKADPMPTTSI